MSLLADAPNCREADRGPLCSASVRPAGVAVSRRGGLQDELALLDGPASDVEVAELVGRSVHAVVMKRWRRRNPAAVARDRVYAEEDRDRNNRRAVIYSHTQQDKINAAAEAAAAADRVAATRWEPSPRKRMRWCCVPT